MHLEIFKRRKDIYSQQITTSKYLYLNESLRYFITILESEVQSNCLIGLISQFVAAMTLETSENKEQKKNFAKIMAN